MRSRIYLSFIVLLTSLSVAQAQGAKVVDTKGNRFELTSVTTKVIALDVGRTSITLPVADMSAIARLPAPDAFAVTLKSGKKLAGRIRTSATAADLETIPQPWHTELEGATELGQFKTYFRDLTSVVFLGTTAQPAEAPTPPGAADAASGIAATCVDRTGARFEATDLRYVDSYSYNPRGPYGVIVDWADNAPQPVLPVEVNEVTVLLPLTSIKSIAATSAAHAHAAGLRISFVDGRTILAQPADAYGVQYERLTGRTEYGRLNLLVTDIRELQLHTAPKVNTNDGQALKSECKSSYTLTLRTWNGQAIELKNACAFQIHHGGAQGDYDTRLAISVGSAQLQADFGQIESLVFDPETTMKSCCSGTLKAKSGQPYRFELLTNGFWNRTFFGGLVPAFGWAWIDARRVATLTISAAQK